MATGKQERTHDSGHGALDTLSCPETTRPERRGQPVPREDIWVVEEVERRLQQDREHEQREARIARQRTAIEGTELDAYIKTIEAQLSIWQTTGVELSRRLRELDMLEKTWFATRRRSKLIGVLTNLLSRAS